MDTGMTYSIFDDTMSVIFISEGTSDEEWFDSVMHELKHVVEHISEYYDLDPRSEAAAYLQGEIGRLMFPMVMRKVCRR
jgi:Zn-dependent peptidase ImmA (M78 family)